MRLPILFSVALAASPLLAQSPSAELLTNGSFTAVLAPWVMGGAYSVNPGLEVGINVTGMGVSDSFGVNAGGQVTPPPYAPNTLEQNVTVVAGTTYEFRMDASGYRNSATGNADIGTIWVELNGVEIARHAFGSYTSPQVKRAQLCGRHTPVVGGNVTLKLFFQRLFLGGAANPRMNVDNASLQDIDGKTPTLCILGNRMLTTSINIRVEGTPTAPYAVFLAAGQIPGVPIPGILGLLYLDPITLTFFLSGTLDGAGVGTTPFTIPGNPALLTTPLYYQAVTALAPTIALSLHTGLVMSQ